MTNASFLLSGEPTRVSPNSKEPITFSIGAVARETGIGIEALRMWERRYGFPRSIRLPSGHRRYPIEEIQRLRLAARALEVGFRARDVASASVEELERMLALAQSGPSALKSSLGESQIREVEIRETVERWLNYSRNYDERFLTEEFHAAWARLGPLRFIQERVAPFSQRVGEGWLAGEVTISQEHFASEKIGDFLGAMWRRLSERSNGSEYLLATLPGDQHRLGLQMCALVVAAADQRVIYIGPQTPPSEIVRFIQRQKVAGVCISISSSMDVRHVAPLLNQLRLDLPPDVHIVIGGSGSPEGLKGIERITDFDAFFDWLRQRVAA
jgi:DNA-binding transcriptional MerR regulator/methylmalonyl-CoA mutase cobalamin-binding subunit